MSPAFVEFLKMAATIMAAGCAGFGGTWLTRRSARGDRLLDEASVGRLAEMKELSDVRRDEREENQQLRGKLDNALETIRAQGEWNARMEERMNGLADDVADVRGRIEAGQGNGAVQRLLVRVEQQLRATSPRFGPAGGSDQLRQGGAP